MNVIDKAGKAKLILVPKGDDSTPCLLAFEQATGIAVPRFEGRMLEAKNGNQTFMKVKGRDIPGLIGAGFGDIGLTGSDSCEEYLNSGSQSIKYQVFGPKMCRFVLLVPRETLAPARKQLKDKNLVTTVATSFPKLLTKCALNRKLRLVAAEVPVSGSVEIMPRLLGVPAVADLVATGSTAKANDLVEVYSLLDVYPALIVRDKSQTNKPAARLDYDDISRIDAMLARRSLQVGDPAAASTTLSLLRDPNLAGKKAGEEFAEVLMAIFGGSTVAECENEIADSIYTQLVAARSLNKPTELGNVMRIMVERNRTDG